MEILSILKTSIECTRQWMFHKVAHEPWTVVEAQVCLAKRL